MQLRKQLGGGSKWRTYLVLGFILAGVMLDMYFKFRQNEFGRYTPYFFVAIFIFSITFVFWKKHRAAKQSAAATNIFEISHSGVMMVMGEHKSSHPWSAFSECLESPKLFVLVDRPKCILYILPKRAFPDENTQKWFRALANERPVVAGPNPIADPTHEPLTGEAVSVEFQLRLSDYFDRTLASWKTWGAIIGLLCLFAGASMYGAMNAGPNPVNSPAKVFFVFCMPFMLLMIGMVIVVVSLQGWLAHRKHLIPQKYLFLENGIQQLSKDGFLTVAWSGYAHYKETRRSIILWRGQVWSLIPKRAFKSRLDQQNCLSLLRRNLRQSRWFFG